MIGGCGNREGGWGRRRVERGYGRRGEGRRRKGGVELDNCEDE